MQMVRRKSRGLNPFTIIVATVDDSDMETVQRLVKAGVDDMIRRPVTGQRLFESIGNLMEQRKPFVVAARLCRPQPAPRPPHRSGRRQVDARSQHHAQPRHRQFGEDELQRWSTTPFPICATASSSPAASRSMRRPSGLVEAYGAFKASPTRAEEVRETRHLLQEPRRRSARTSCRRSRNSSGSAIWRRWWWR